MRFTFIYLLAMTALIGFFGTSASLRKSTQYDCEKLGPQSLACKQLQKTNFINEVLN